MTRPPPTRQYLLSEMTATYFGSVRCKSLWMTALFDVIALLLRMMFSGSVMVV